MVTKEQVYEALHECYDPEIPVNIVDLGLVYDVEINDDKVAVKMTSDGAGLRHGHDDRRGCQRKRSWRSMASATRPSISCGIRPGTRA